MFLHLALTGKAATDCYENKIGPFDTWRFINLYEEAFFRYVRDSDFFGVVSANGGSRQWT